MKKRNVVVWACFILAGVLLTGVSAAFAQGSPGVTEKEILIGSTYPLSGPLSAFGVIGKGQEIYYKYINDRGGVHGRKVVFKYMDDAYQPPKTLQVTRQLVEQENVFMLVNGLGTPTQTAVQDYLNEKKVPQLFVNSGASKWGADPKKFPWSMGFAPNYQDEAAVYARYLMSTKPNAKVGILYQNDDYGMDYVEGFERALGDKKSMLVAKFPYEVASGDVNSQLQNLKRAGADTLLWAASSKFVAQGLRSNSQLGWKPLNIVNVPAAQKAVLDQAGAEAAEGVISSAYIKDPSDPTWDNDAGMKFFRELMTKYYPEGDPKSLSVFQGATAAWITIKVLEQAGKDLTREKVMQAATNMNYSDCPFALPGIVIKTTPTDWRPFDQLRLMRYEGGKFVLFGDIISAR
jgi:branched-chain amino acid transport system substrate-binding protein